MSERLSVAVRVRPFLPHESLASCVSVRENQIAIGDSKSFAFDRVFDMAATSDDVYVTLGQPLADSFLSGYHASTIAYGQTGAGKTFTMAALLNDTVQEIFCRLSEEAAETGSSNEAHNTNNSALLPRNGSTTSSQSPSANRAASPGGSPGTATAAAASPLLPAPAFTMSLTVLEVYNEAVGDLLSRHAGHPYATTVGTGSSSSNYITNNNNAYSGNAFQRGNGFGPDKRTGGPGQKAAPLQLREDPTGGVYVVGLTEVHVESEARLLALIDDAIGNRKTASTLMNATSSRSHCVITLTLQRKGMCSRCCFVDLAGSERLKKSLGFGAPVDRYGATGGTNSNTYNISGGGGASGNFIHHNGVNTLNGSMGSPPEPGLAPANAAVRMREGININSGLLALGNVIVALCERKSHVPYRASKLTRLLQPMLEGNSRTAMIACVAPLASSLEETLNTLKYADRAKRIHINPHLAVATTSSAADAQQLINLLREQLEEAKVRLAALAAHAPPSHGHVSTNGSTDGGEMRSNKARAAAAYNSYRNSSDGCADPSSSTRDEVEELRQLLVQEQEITKRLESDLFNAEYTAMVEVEKRKALEARVAQLEAALQRHREKGSCDEDSDAEGEDEAEDYGRGTEMYESGHRHARLDHDGDDTSPTSTFLSTAAPSPRARLTRNMARLQQLQEERESLAAMRARRVRDTQRLAAALAAGGTSSRLHGAATGADDADTASCLKEEEDDEEEVFISDVLPPATAHLAHLTMDQLTEEMQQKESQIAQLQRENDEVSAQLAHFEHELKDTLAEKARLQEELRKAEVQLERSVMERELKEQEKATLRAGYLERIRRAEVKATEYRRRVREAEQAMRVRQESIDKTKQLQEKIAQLREEVSRQRQEVRTAKRQSDLKAAAHQHEVTQLQLQLQVTTAQVAQLHQRMERKDAAIAKVKKQLQEQQLQQQQAAAGESAAEAAAAATMTTSSQSAQLATPSTPPPPPPPPTNATSTPSAPVQTPTTEAASAPPVMSLHKVPAHKQNSSRRISLKQPPSSTASPSAVSLSDTPPEETSPVRITKRRHASSHATTHNANSNNNTTNYARASSSSASSVAQHRSPPPPLHAHQRHYEESDEQQQQQQQQLSRREGKSGEDAEEAEVEERGAAQAQINKELQDLERMEKELAELKEYREVLLSAQTTDAPKWHRAKEGFTRRLAAIQSDLRTAEAGSTAHASLLKEEADVAEKLRQLQAYRHMFEDADEQLAEFDNRIENLNDARRFHLQRIRRLQQSVTRSEHLPLHPRQRRRSQQDSQTSDTMNHNSISSSSGHPGLSTPQQLQQETDNNNKNNSSVSLSTTAAEGVEELPSLPSVREIRATQLACAAPTFTHHVISHHTSSPQQPPSRALKTSSSDAAAYTAALEAQVARLQAETLALQAKLKAA